MLEILLQTLVWGLVIGVIHFIVVGFLYQNPLVAKMYKDFADHPAMKKWDSLGKYIVSMALGTQVEIFIMTFSYLILVFTMGKNLDNSIVIALIFSAIRVYPRFWNMWIQTNYPNKLLVVEMINGTLGTWIVILGLYFLPTL